MTTTTQILLSHATNVKVKICDAPKKKKYELCNLSFNTSEILKIQDFWDVTTSRPVNSHRCFGRSHCLHIQYQAF